MSALGTSAIGVGRSLARAAGLALRGEDDGCGGSLLIAVCSLCFLLLLEVYFHTLFSVILKILMNYYCLPCVLPVLCGSFLPLIISLSGVITVTLE